MADNFDRLFKNAIDSIEMGVEDFIACKMNRNERRIISSARNIYAGILLLFKAKLLKLSSDNNEALIQQQIDPQLENGKIIWIGKGKKTIDYSQIKERFKALGINQINWGLLGQIQTYRNNVEHYFDSNNLRPDVLQSMIANTYVIICDFMRRYMNIKPYHCFNRKIWKVLCDSKKEFDLENQERLELIKSLSWQDENILNFFLYQICSCCGSFLLLPTQKETFAEDCDFKCSDCGSIYTYQELTGEYFANLIQPSRYSINKMDESQIIYTCPECGKESYNTETQRCLSCGATGPFKCPLCNSEIPNNELDEFCITELCSDCYRQSEMNFDED